MLRRATTELHRQCLTHHPLSKRLQNPTHRCPFSSLPEKRDDTFAEQAKNSTTHALPGADDPARASAPDNNNVTPITRHGRIRSLRPILVPPSFPSSSQLLPVMPIPEPETSPSSDLNTETDPFSSSSSSSSTTVILTYLPPKTVKADILAVFQRFGEIASIFVQPDGRRANVVFADVLGVTRTLHASAEEPLRVRGEEIILFRKHVEVDTVSDMDMDTDTDTPSQATQTGRGHDDGVIFVSDLPPMPTEGELAEALELFGAYEHFMMHPGSQHAYFKYSNKDCVDDILTVHEIDPIIVRGRTLRIERAEKLLFDPSPGAELELGKPLDPATSSAILKELTRTVPGFRGAHKPTRVLWIGGLPTSISQTALTNFWSRLGCVVDARPSTKGYAYIEFASIEEGLRAVRKGAPHGFRYEQRLLDIDYNRSILYVGPVFRTVYISGWPASDDRSALLRWAYDIPNVVEAAVLPPFREENSSDLRGAFLRFRMMDDARTAIRKLDGRMGPGGETLHMVMSRPPAVQSNQMWRWAHEVEEMRKSGGGEGGEACLEDEWEGLGFATGEEEQDDSWGVEY